MQSMRMAEAELRSEHMTMSELGPSLMSPAPLQSNINIDFGGHASAINISPRSMMKSDREDLFHNLEKIEVAL